MTIQSGVFASSDGGRTWELQQVGPEPLAIAAADAEHVVATATTALPHARVRATAARRGGPPP